MIDRIMSKKKAVIIGVVAVIIVWMLYDGCAGLPTERFKSHEYVDLGLSVKWATCNVGAEKPEEYGNYYAWGEIKTKSKYTESNCSTFDNWMIEEVGLGRDVAHKRWGSTWRMPTYEECKELIDSCTWTWTTVNEVNGYTVTSNKNGNSIFLPAAGWREGKELKDVGDSGNYWSSSPFCIGDKASSDLCFTREGCGIGGDFRSYGLSIRPVTE